MSDKMKKDRILGIYINAVEVNNTIETIENLTKEYFKKNWSTAVASLARDLEFIETSMLAQGYSFDYQQAHTLLGYVKIFEFLVSRIQDQLMSYDEGFSTISFIQKALREVADPFIAFVCTRVKENNVEIPVGISKIYNKYEEKMYEMKDVDLGGIFELMFRDEDEEYDDLGLSEVQSLLEKIDESDLKNLDLLTTKLVEYVESKELENVKLDF